MEIKLDTHLTRDKEIQRLIIWALKDKRRRQNFYKVLSILLMSKVPVSQSVLQDRLGISKDRLYKFIREVVSIITTKEIVQVSRGYAKSGISRSDVLMRFRGRYSVRDRNKAGFIIMVLDILNTAEAYYANKRARKRTNKRPKARS